jgi:hypothetical protein
MKNDPSYPARRRAIDLVPARGGLLLCIAVLAALSCSKKERGFATEIVNGVKVVRNLALKPEKATRSLGFVEEISIGGDDAADDDLLFAPVDIDADPEGTIYVLDGRDAVIRLFDKDGRFVRTIGRKGQGPGEFEGPACMDVAPDGRIIVVDQSLMRLTVMAQNGDFIGSHIIKEHVFDIRLAKNGALVAAYSDPQRSRDCVGAYDLESGQATPLFSQETYWPARIMNKEMTYDFPYFVRFALSAADRLYAGSGAAYEISVMDTTGRTELKFTKEKERIPVQGEMLDRISNMTLRGPNPYVRSPHFPFFGSLAVDEKGRVWVQHYLPKISKTTNPETPYDLFSPDGVFLFETRIPGHIFSKLVFKNGSIYALKKMESGYLHALRLRPVDPD